MAYLRNVHVSVYVYIICVYIYKRNCTHWIDIHTAGIMLGYHVGISWADAGGNKAKKKTGEMVISMMGLEEDNF